ncbi:hypothetical protein U9M48_001457 [Paspalum notatum var. saurae]|uniref:Uncharacterized protein n=1 Tax=Paspalum notatum var. saurae TaxID=547442 RepID=A0AAQ3PPG8_PASNO
MWLRLLTTKDRAAEAIKEIGARAEAKEAALATDGREEASSHLWSSAILRESRRGTPPLGAILTTANGVVERKNRTVVGMARCEGHAGGVRGEAVTMAVYILNHASTKALDGQTPFEAWHRRKPDVSHLRTFGCVGYVKVTKPGP